MAKKKEKTFKAETNAGELVIFTDEEGTIYFQILDGSKKGVVTSFPKTEVSKLVAFLKAL